MDHLVSPSLLAADFGNLAKDVLMVNSSEADWIHCDIMDGVFVPNISFGFAIIEHVKKIAKKPLDVHLMIVDPDRYLSRFREAGADILTVQYEAVNPGFGGQSFIMESYNKIAELRKMIDNGGNKVLIEVDGGIDTKNARKLIDTGVNVLVAGNSVFSSANPTETIWKLKRLQ
jgi:ribulose-phosphate 3-epimerase